MTNLKLLNANSKKLEKASKGIREFISNILDESSFVETDVFMAGISYIDGSEALGEGVVTGYGTLNDYPVTIVAQNNEVLGGSLSKAQADKILNAISRAAKTNTPLISVIDSKGARVGEGVAVLEGYAKIITEATNLKNFVPHIAIIKGNSVGLMSAYAHAADFVFMSADSVLSLNPPLAVISKANKNNPAKEMLGQKAHSEGNLGCTFSFKKPEDIKATIISLFDFIQKPVIDNEDDPNRTADILNTSLNTKNLFDAICDDKKYLELYESFSPSVKTIISSINSITVGIIMTNSDGKSERLDRKAIKKIKRFIKILESYNIPLITLVDSIGVEISLEEEISGLSFSCSKLIQSISTCEITKIAVVVGRAIGYSYTTLCSKSIGFDYVLALPHSVIAPLSSEVAVSVVYKEEIESAKDPLAAREKLAQKYTSEESSPFISAKDGYVDNIIEPSLLRPYLSSILIMLER